MSQQLWDMIIDENRTTKPTELKYFGKENLKSFQKMYILD